MQQIAQNYKTGNVSLEDVDPPAVKYGTVLIRTAYSAISPGTEGTKISEAKMNYLEKAKARPDQVKKVMESVRQQGLLSTYSKVMNKLDSLSPLGYSASGMVEGVGRGVSGFYVGQKVALAGAGYANHAEFNAVPASLIVPVPDDVSMQDAAFATIGSVSLHALRQGDLQIGEVAVVVGLGLVGQLLVQLLEAAGVSVIGLDIDPVRCEMAVKASRAEAAGLPGAADLQDTMERLTKGYGADCVFLTVGSDDNTALESALQYVRDRGRIVCVGKTKMDLPYERCFKKEVEFRYSRSYGPGRYDAAYEEKNRDYPHGYVRWTEGRNLSAFISLLQQKKLSVTPLITDTFSFSDAVAVYEDMHAGMLNGIGMLFKYDLAAVCEHKAPVLSQTDAVKDSAGIGCIGAGSYAGSMLLPHFKNHPQVRMEAVANATPLSAKNAHNKFGFAHAGTNHAAWLREEAIDAVIIGTRHASHPRFVADTLYAGKAVFVEKPLAIDRDGLEQVKQAATESGNLRVHVGFNRRFSPIMREMKQHIRGAVSMHYRVHAGSLDATSWVNDKDEGGRFIGEAGHFFDVFAYLAESRPVQVAAAALQSEHALAEDDDNLAVTVTYANGSVATLHYLTHGGDRLPKERLEVSGGNQTIIMDNFEKLILFDRANKPVTRKGFGNNKGQKQQVAEFIKAVLEGTEMPISLSSLYETTELTLAAVEAAQSHQLITFS